VLLLAGLLGISGCATTGSHTGTAKDRPLVEFAWLAGSWVEVEEGMRMEEHWTPPAGGIMLGTSRTVNQDRLAFFEYLRIEETPSGVVYVAHPRGGNATAFPLVEAPTADSCRAVFENLKHDHPQRIIYERKGRDTLYIKIEGEPEGAPAEEDWLMRRMDGGGCPWMHPRDDTREVWEPVRTLARRVYGSARVAAKLYALETDLPAYLAQELRSALCRWGWRHGENVVKRICQRQPEDHRALVSSR